MSAASKADVLFRNLTVRWSGWWLQLMNLIFYKNPEIFWAQFCLLRIKHLIQRQPNKTLWNSGSIKAVFIVFLTWYSLMYFLHFSHQPSSCQFAVQPLALILPPFSWTSQVTQKNQGAYVKKRHLWCYFHFLKCFWTSSYFGLGWVLTVNTLKLL